MDDHADDSDAVVVEGQHRGREPVWPLGSRVHSALLTIINVVAISCGAGGKWS